MEQTSSFKGKVNLASRLKEISEAAPSISKRQVSSKGLPRPEPPRGRSARKSKVDESYKLLGVKHEACCSSPPGATITGTEFLNCSDVLHHCSPSGLMCRYSSQQPFFPWPKPMRESHLTMGAAYTGWIQELKHLCFSAGYHVLTSSTAYG